MLTAIEMWILKIYLERLITDSRNPYIGYSRVTIEGINQTIVVLKNSRTWYAFIHSNDGHTFGINFRGCALEKVEQFECDNMLLLDFGFEHSISIGEFVRVIVERCPDYDNPDNIEKIVLTREQINAGIPDGSIPAPIDLIEW